MESPVPLSPNLGLEYSGFDHIGWYVGNARQAASYFVSHFGFTAVAYRGPETGSYLTSSYVVANGAVRFVFTGPITGPENEWEVRASEDDRQLLNEIHDHLRKHGDGVKDIAFEVNDVEAIWAYASKRNGTVITEPTTLNEGTDGEVRLATIQTYGDTVHTLIDRSKYRGLFLPGFKAIAGLDKLNSLLPPVELIDIDHCVGNQPWDGLDGAVK